MDRFLSCAHSDQDLKIYLIWKCVFKELTEYRGDILNNNCFKDTKMLVESLLSHVPPKLFN